MQSPIAVSPLAEPDKFRVTYECVMCIKPKALTITRTQYAELYQSPDRRNIQEVLPDMDKADRELILSGTCGECFLSLFRSGTEHHCNRCGQNYECDCPDCKLSTVSGCDECALKDGHPIESIHSHSKHPVNCEES